MAIITFAEAAKLSPAKLYQKIFYGAMQDDPIWGYLPMQWMAESAHTFFQTTTLPTTAFRLETDAMTSTAPVRVPRTVYLRPAYTQLQVPQFNEESTSNVINQRAQNAREMAISYGAKVRSAVMVSCANTVAIGATCTTKGIDGFIPCARMYQGLTSKRIYLSYDDTGKTIKLSTDGVTYGATVSTAADLHQIPLYDGVDPTLFAYVDFDVSDSNTGGDWITTTDATGVLLTTSKECDGMKYWIYPTQRIWGNMTVSATDTGDALSLEMLDWLYDMVPGMDAYIMTKRTRRSYKQLLQSTSGVGSEMTKNFMGTELALPVLGYAGKPVLACENIPLTERCGVVGAGCSTAAPVYAVRFARSDEDDAFAILYNTIGGPSVKVNDGGELKNVPVPGYWRVAKQEMESYPDSLLRLDGYFAPVLRNIQALAEVHGIKD